MRSVLERPTHLRALALTVVMMFAGFSVIPFISPFLVGNVGVREADLVYIYLVGGAFTLFTGPLAGRLADRFGTPRVFAGAALVSIVPILVLTHLPPVRLATALVVSTVFMIFVSARMVVATTMITNSVEPRQRGSFMAVNSSVQQMAAGIASASAGLLIVDAGGGRLHGYGGVGVLAAGTTLAAVLVARRLRPAEAAAEAPVMGVPPRLGEVVP
jgi:predicted MFS family arabinose efflux permease